jgi:transposase
MATERYPETELLQQVAGVGPITAATFVLTVEDPTRFPRCRSIGSYLGLRPRRDESGTINRQLRITKAGDGALRSLLVSCSQYILGHFGPDTDLRRWGLHLAEARRQEWQEARSGGRRPQTIGAPFAALDNG